jgi:hypothetical protein
MNLFSRLTNPFSRRGNAFGILLVLLHPSGIRPNPTFVASAAI